MEDQCVISCPLPYTEDFDTQECVRNFSQLASFPVIFILLMGLGGLIVLFSSMAVSRNTDKSVEIVYALTTVIECLNRIFLLGNLWASTSVFSFAVCFMDIVATAVLGIFFYNLFLQPILIHSPHFRTIFKEFKKTYYFIIGTSFVVGVNFIRLLFARIYGTKSTSAELNQYTFFLKPLNNMANFTAILTAIQTLLCAVLIGTVGFGKDAWTLAVFGLALNLFLVLLALFKHFAVKRFLKAQQSTKPTPQ